VLTIGLDYDNTFTADPKAWQQFIGLMLSHGHRVFITTSRSPDLELEIIPHGIDGIVYCSFRAKKTVTQEQGIKINIWIDDDPKWIEEGFVESDLEVIRKYKK
jgi:hypothetical protein